MALFQYKAVSPSGDTITGQMEAGSSGEVIARLQEAGNMPISASEQGTGIQALLGGLAMRGKRVSAKDIGQFTQQMATLLGAGLPLDRALGTLEELADSDAMRDMVKNVRDQVRGGTSLSEAIEQQHATFSKLYINMVRAGEAGGTLDVTLQRLAEYMARSKELKDTIVSAMIYPAILLFLAIGSLFILLAYVVPQFAPIFEELGGEMPLLTKIVLGFADFLQSFWWAVIAAGFGVVLFARQQMANPTSRRIWDARFLKTKIIGDVIAKIEMARFARTTGTLLTNGVAMLGALAIGEKVMTNTVMTDAVNEAAKEVKTGGPLAHNLAKSKLFPKLALQMINVGEETGQLDDMLVKVADTYDTEVRLAIDRALAMLVPALTLGLAAFIAIIVMSILMAILSVNDLIAA